ncbi:hypothetical protein [Cetobacterium sp.]|uniref:hypothetical protein n=1 Tax=Cetobacterium sp. TaxID=2071632 RepID=UPI003EE6280E
MKQVKIKINKQKRKKLEKLAKESKMTLSEFVRSKVDESIKKGLKLVKTEQDSCLNLFITDEQFEYIKNNGNVNGFINKSLEEV